MATHQFTIGSTLCKGFRIGDGGSVEDFEGTIPSAVNSLKRANSYIRRLYKDNSITIAELKSVRKKYRCDMDALMKISEPID